MNKTENELLKLLDGKIYHPSAVRMIDEIAARVEGRLQTNSRSLMEWESVPLDVFGGVPEMIRSSWIFILRGRADIGAERHPNSHQRSMSYRGEGTFYMMENDEWVPHSISDTRDHPIDDRWVSIPVHGWHRVVAGPKNWVIVSFHTVQAEELIEEKMVGNDPSQTHRQPYL
jgi:hypothetical protein